MKRNHILTLGFVALALSVAATLLAYRFLESRMAPPTEVVNIVVASRKLTVGTRLTADDVKVASWPRSIVIEGATADTKDIVGRGVIVSILPNEPILASKLAPAEAGAGLASLIPDGMRAVAVKVNDVIGVAGFAIPGTRVDVILSGSPVQGNETDTSKIILENVQVLASGQNVEQDASGKPQNVQVITLLVTPEDAQKVALASVDGKIQLALRNSLDLEFTDPPPALRKALYAQSGAAASAPAPRRPAVVRAPAPPPPPPVVEPPVPRTFTVDLYQGKEHNSVTFELP